MQQSTAVIIPKIQRIVSIDVLRGLVMIIMALDHVRDYFHAASFLHDPLDLSQTSPAIFLTRWITHFCAPVFVFLAGTSAFLTGLRKGKKALSKFLFTRGLWLIFIEITVITFGWTFDIHFTFIGLQTIWALGVGMIALSILLYLPKRVLLALGLILIGGHNAFDSFHVNGNGADAFAWSVLHDPRPFSVGGFNIFVAYPVLSWIGVMLLGYCFGELYVKYNPEQRKKILVSLGSACIVVFIALRSFNFYGDAQHWTEQKNLIFSILSFINVTKYPPSLLYILVTLGPAIIFLAFTEKKINAAGRIISVYGRVPMFYYILHIYIIHLANIFTAHYWGYSWSEIITNPFLNPIKGFGFPLWIVYLIWIAVVVLLYPLCKKYDRYKLANKQKWWLSYL